MGRNHKKLVRSEKTKVKLKGNKLPKGLNVTKTEFKIKKIIIKEQLQANSFEDGKRIHTVKDILSRLRHHNASYRAEALRNLKDMFSNKSEAVFRDLATIVQGLSMLCLDIEKDIRRESYKVLCDFFTIFNSSIIRPFFHVISSYLRCAMTHLNQSIQEDSLLLLDVLLVYLPELVNMNSDRIFNSFLEMISKLRTDSKPGRTLTINVGAKTTTTRWRTKILDRLQKMLQIMIQDLKIENNTLNNNWDKKSITKYFVVNQPQYYPILHIMHSDQKYDASRIFNRSSLGKNDEYCENDQGEKIRKYINYLLPLLLESWLEVKPTAKEIDTFKSEILLSSDAAGTLKIILEILDDLWEMTKIWESQVNRSNYLSIWFSKEFVDDFTCHILHYFPYQQSEGKQINNKKKDKMAKKDLLNTGGEQCIKQNLSIIYLFAVFYGRKISSNQKNSSIILDHLLKMISNLKQIPLDCVELLEKVLEVVLYTKGVEFMAANNIKTKSLLGMVIDQFEKGNFNKNSKANILRILCNIVLSNNLRKIYGNENFINWLPKLPEMLLKSNISEHVVRTLSCLGKQGNQEFLIALGKIIENVIDNICVIKVDGCGDSFEGRKLIMNLFYWINYWTDDERKNLINSLNSKITDQQINSYFTFIVMKA